MKKSLLLLTVIALLASCNNANTQKKEQVMNEEEALENVISILTTEELKSKSFDELFKPIDAAEISESVFKLVGSDFTVITSGTEADYNSMIASWGGMGILFNKPATWCFLRANRYTLEYIRKEQTYTLAYFDEPYKDKIMIFGTKSGRNTDKMKEHELTAVQTPQGSIAYKEAKLIIECKITQLTTVSPKDFYTQEGKDFITEAYKEAKDYHKLLLGEITGVWEKK